MIENAWRLLNATNEWVRFADAKAGGALAGAGVLAAALGSAGLSDSFSSAPDGAVVLGGLAGLAALVSAALALQALAPRLKVGEPVSLIYFDHVARRYKDDTAGHSEAVRELLEDEERYFKEIAAQVWANSIVARRKLRASNWSLSILAVGVLLTAVASIISLS